MKHKTISIGAAGIFTILLTATLVLAQVGEGDTITQQQLDSIDASTYNLQCQLEDVGQNHLAYVAGHWYYYRNVSCLSIIPISINETTNEYLIIRKNHYPLFRVFEYFDCRQENPANYCNTFFTDVLIEQHQHSVSSIRDKIRFFQTREGDAGETDFGDGFEI